MESVDKDSIFWNLATIQVDNRHIRYFSLPVRQAPPTEKASEDGKMPLFLGADVLLKCGSYASKNLARVHSKFAAEGLATKVFLPQNYKIKSIRGIGDSVWFYTIQGLFRIGFEFYTRQEQRSLLEKLQGCWIARINDSPLESNLVLTTQHISANTRDCLKNDLVCHDDHQSTSNSDMGNRHENDSTEISLSLNKSEDVDQCRHKQYAGHSPIDIVSENLYTDQSQLYDKEEQNNTNGGTELKNSKDNFFQNVHHIDSSLQAYSKKIEIIISKVLMHYNNESSIDILYSYVESFIELCIQEKNNITNEQSTAFPIKLIKDYMELKELELETHQDHELSMHVLSSWVGEKFSLFRSVIKNNVDAFKLKHINRISDLPQTEDIIKQIFPSAMYSLLYIWMQGHVDTYSQMHEHASEAKSSALTCLLVLELLNNAPITGIGHYVHSLLQAA